MDGTINKYAELTGCPETMFADENAVKQARDADAKAAAQAQQLQAVETGAKAAAAAGGMPIDEQHAGSRLMEALSGGVM